MTNKDKENRIKEVVIRIDNRFFPLQFAEVLNRKKNKKNGKE